MKKLPTYYQEYIAKSRYARWRDDLGRREHWHETVQRYFDFLDTHLKENFPRKAHAEFKAGRGELEQAVLNLDIMPSMRCLMTAGVALNRCHVAGYNCAYTPIDDPRSFDEIMYILMCGTGVGFSVEQRYINKLPTVSETFTDTDTKIIVPDTRDGWASSFRELVSLLYTGRIPKWDMSKIRPAGARLKTFGGRASGPEPLDLLFRYCIDVFKKAAGRKLTALECHDIVCKVGDVVVVGGVRRSALISLSDVEDRQMRVAKQGNWYETARHRELANNSAVYNGTPDVGTFLREWTSLYDSKSGERGIFNRQASRDHVLKYGHRDGDFEFGTNPCSEIILRPHQFCNLTEVVIRSDDSLHDLEEKCRLATVLGTYQSTLTNFKYIRKVWQRNTEEERLLGVSLTGIFDNPLLLEQDTLPRSLTLLRESCRVQNTMTADTLKIPHSTAITCVKPSGTVSQLCNTASGIHPRHSEFYIRRVRADAKDPLAQFMIDQGIPNEPAIGSNGNVIVFSFPMRSPPTAMTKSSLGAIDHLEIWRTYQEHWCEHKPSVTISVKEEEWIPVGAWVYKNFEILSGVSFLPFFEGESVYKQLPYETCTEDAYNELRGKMPTEIDWELLTKYESEDNTSETRELACQAGACEL